MGLRGWIKKQARDTKKSYEQLGREAKKEAQKAGGGIEDLFNKIKRELERTANKAKNEIESTANKAKREVEGAAKDVKREVEKLPKQVEKELKKVLDALNSEVFKQTLPLILKAAKEAKKRMDWLKKNKPAIASAIDDVSFAPKLGPVVLKFTRFYERADTIIGDLEALLKKDFKIGRKSIREIIRAIGPDSIDLGIDVNLAALVVTSDAVGLGFSLPELPLELGLEILDEVLKACGVPA